MAVGYKSRDVVELSRDPFGKRPSRPAVIISSAARPREPDETHTQHTITPMTSQVEEYGSHSWAVVLDKEDATVDQDLTYDSVIEPWMSTPASEKLFQAQIARLTTEAMREIAEAHARMILDDDP